MVADNFEDKNLGLPVIEGRMKARKFQSIKDKFLKRREDWTEKFFSGVTKEVLIKYVLQALPTYAMGIFKFPVTFCVKLSQIIRDYWWGDENERKKVHWFALEETARPKCHEVWAFMISVFLTKLG